MPPKGKKGDKVRGRGPKHASKRLLPRSGEVEHRPGRDLHMSEAVVVGSQPGSSNQPGGSLQALADHAADQLQQEQSQQQESQATHAAKRPLRAAAPKPGAHEGLDGEPDYDGQSEDEYGEKDANRDVEAQTDSDSEEGGEEDGLEEEAGEEEEEEPPLKKGKKTAAADLGGNGKDDNKDLEERDLSPQQMLEAIARVQKAVEASRAAGKISKRGVPTLWFKAAQEGLVLLSGPAIRKASGKMKNKVPGEKKPTLAKQLAGVPEKLMTYMKEEVGVQLPNGYYNIDNVVRKLNAMKSDAKKLLGNLKDTKPNSSGRELTAEELYDFAKAEQKLPWIKLYAQAFEGNQSYLPIPPIETQGGAHPPGTALDAPGEIYGQFADPFARPEYTDGDPSEAMSPPRKGKGKCKASTSSQFIKPASGTGSQLRMEKFMEEQAEKQQAKQETMLKDLFATMYAMKKEDDAKAHERKKEEDAKAHERQMEIMRMQQQFMATLFAHNSQQQQQQQSVTAHQHPLAMQAARQHPIMPHTALSPQLTPFPQTMGAQQSSPGGGYDTQLLVPNSQPQI